MMTSTMNSNPFPDNGRRPECGGCKDRKAPQACCDQHYICNQKLLKDVAARLPGDWEKLGIYLGVSKQERDRIGGEKRNKVEAWGLDMFDKWWQNAKPESRWSDLQNALTEVHRHDLIQFTKDFFAANQVDPTNPADHKMQKYFQKMAEQIPRDWKDIGIYLYLSLDDLNAIQMAGNSAAPNTRTFDILEAWKKKPNFNCAELQTALEEIGRRDVIMFIEQEVRDYKTVCCLHEQARQREREEQEQLEHRRRALEEEQQLEQRRRELQQLERQIEQQRQHLERQQLQQPGFRPTHPPTENYIPPNERNFEMQPARFAPQASHQYRQDPQGPPPGTAFNQGAGVFSVHPHDSVSRQPVIAQATPDPSITNAHPEPRPPSDLLSTDVNSIHTLGSNPSFGNSLPTELTDVARVRTGIEQIQLNGNRDGTDGNISANTFATDLTAENTDDSFSLVGVGDGANPNPVSVPSTHVSVDVEDVDVDIQAEPLS